MTFSWATIRVRNLEDSLAFYHNLLGLPIHDRFGPPGHQIVMLGTDPGTKLELIESAEPLPEVPAPGLSLGFAPENMRISYYAVPIGLRVFCSSMIPVRPLCPPIHPFVSTSYKTPTGM